MSTAAPFIHPDRLPGSEASTSHHSGSESARGRGARGRGRGGRGASGAAQGFPGTIPAGSISKLKSQLRQTRRLLTREDLTPDVRTTTERRLKTLEVELEKASTSELEKKMVTRYRGIRFFERQKILRKIKQTKKSLVASPGDANLLQTLLESRIDLYYILQYPKTQKYIALFPEGTYVPHSSPASTTSTSTKKDSSSDRAALRESIRARIENGTLSEEAEGGDLGIEGEEDVGSGPAGEEREKGEERSAKRNVEQVEAEEVEEQKDEEERPKKKVKKVKEVREVEEKVEEKVEEMEMEREAEPEPEAEAVEELKEVEPVAEVAEVRGVRQTKKEKKDLKDKKRREKKEADEKAKLAALSEPTPEVVAEASKETTKVVKGVPSKGKGKKGVEASEPEKVVETWAGEDDFFA